DAQRPRDRVAEQLHRPVRRLRAGARGHHHDLPAGGVHLGQVSAGHRGGQRLQRAGGGGGRQLGDGRQPRPHQVRDDLARAGRGRLRRVGEQHQVRAVLARLDQRRGPLHVQRHRVGDRDDPGGDRHARLQQPTQRDRGGGDRGGGRGGAVLRTTVLYTAVLRGGRRGRLAEGGEVRGGLGHRVAGPALGGGLLGGGSLLAGGFLLSGFGRCAVLFFCRRFRAAGRGAGPQ